MAFVKEIVPRRAIAATARLLYGEKYAALPMRHSIAGGTVEYRVEHPRWRVWQLSRPVLDCDAASFYGAGFAVPLSRPPSSVFVADGSAVTVYRGAPLPHPSGQPAPASPGRGQLPSGRPCRPGSYRGRHRRRRRCRRGGRDRLARPEGRPPDPAAPQAFARQ